MNKVFKHLKTSETLARSSASIIFDGANSDERTLNIDGYDSIKITSTKTSENEMVITLKAGGE